MSRAIEERVVELARVLTEEREPKLVTAEALARLKGWQSARLALTFADLHANPRFNKATEFFLDELYGESEVGWRDRDLNRVLPYFRRWLPRGLLQTLADTLELDLISHRLDVAVCAALGTALRGQDNRERARYAQAYRAAGQREQRERQLDLLQSIGKEIDRWSRSPLLPALLRIARGPARGAGLNLLQGFLERGFSAFRQMHGAGEFLGAIETRERETMRRLFAAHPEPFEWRS